MVKEAAIRKDGRIFTGHRHADILHANAVRNESGIIVSTIASGEQGFVSDAGEFLTREEAAEHALKCDQIKWLKFSRTQLFSEDLY
jgi:hypothetical protein